MKDINTNVCHYRHVLFSAECSRQVPMLAASSYVISSYLPLFSSLNTSYCYVRAVKFFGYNETHNKPQFNISIDDTQTTVEF